MIGDKEVVIVEEQGIIPFTKQEYLITVNCRLGHRCGYVRVSSNSLFYKKSYTENIIRGDDCSSIEYNVNVHGGVTYSGTLGKEFIGSEYPFYFGFDCSHLGDRKISIEDMKKIIFNLSNISEQKKQELLNNYINLQNIFRVYNDLDINSIVRTVDYVRKECFRLGEQLLSYEIKIKKGLK